MRLPTRIGVAYPNPTSTRHFCSRLSGHEAGTLKAPAPSLAGPRHCGQSWEKTTRGAIRIPTNIAAARIRFMPSPLKDRIDLTGDGNGDQIGTAGGECPSSERASIDLSNPA